MGNTVSWGVNILARVFSLRSLRSYRFCTSEDLFSISAPPSLSSWFPYTLGGRAGVGDAVPFRRGGLSGSTGLRLRWPWAFDWLVRKKGHGIDSTNSLVHDFVSLFLLRAHQPSLLGEALPLGSLLWAQPGLGTEAPPYFFREPRGSRGGRSSLGKCHRWFTSGIFSLWSVCVLLVCFEN